MMRYSCEPLRAVGLEGVFGLSMTLVIMSILHLLIGRTDAGRGGVFDAYNGIHEVIDNTAVWGIAIAIALSIGAFNLFGLAVTRSLSAAARSTIDTSRTIGIWLVSLLLGWEEFQLLQVLGFVLVAYGTAVFNVRRPASTRSDSRRTSSPFPRCTTAGRRTRTSTPTCPAFTSMTRTTTRSTTRSVTRTRHRPPRTWTAAARAGLEREGQRLSRPTSAIGDATAARRARCSRTLDPRGPPELSARRLDLYTASALPSLLSTLERRGGAELP